MREEIENEESQRFENCHLFTQSTFLPERWKTHGWVVQEAFLGCLRLISDLWSLIPSYPFRSHQVITAFLCITRGWIQRGSIIPIVSNTNRVLPLSIDFPSRNIQDKWKDFLQEVATTLLWIVRWSREIEKYATYSAWHHTESKCRGKKSKISLEREDWVSDNSSEGGKRSNDCWMREEYWRMERESCWETEEGIWSIQERIGRSSIVSLRWFFSNNKSVTSPIRDRRRFLLKSPKIR